ncbi:hypothetical protein [Povalibacter sp.]|uniref:ATP-binding protein n=1 Tax=Povalibacter sp. TaxID=1962978 RepID=UPI002F3F8E65
MAAARELRISGARLVPGHVYGLRAPGAVARIDLEDPAYWRAVARRARGVIASHLSIDVSFEQDDASGDDAAVLSCLASLVQALQTASGLPALGPMRILAAVSKDAASSRESGQWLLAVPSLAPAAALDALLWSVRYLNASAAKPDEAALSNEHSAELQSLLARMGRQAPKGANNRFFIGAAYQLDIPFMSLPGGVFQYGWGRRAQWLDSSFTEATSTMSTRLARGKTLTNALLRQAGLPVPAQLPVRTLQQALDASATLGYPVALKPADRDGGVGVSAGLKSESELSSAFDRARAFSSELLIEKHIEGRDYRVYVFRGRAISAIERVPAAVTGDGVASVRELVAQVNLDPRRGTQSWAPMSIIEIDEEAVELLANEGLTLDSVAAAGHFMRLRRAANISVGGTPVRVFEQMHPDNARLCERAARILRLDLAGVDLLMPDISRSWRQVGGGICEVNAQPQLSGDAVPGTHARVLGELVSNRGRIPTAIVLTTNPDAALARETADLLSQRNLCAGTSSESGLWIGTQQVRAGRGNAVDDTRALLIDPSVDAVVIGTDGKAFRGNGLPLDRFDVLVVADWVTAGDDDKSAAVQLRSLLLLLLPHCAGEVLVARDHPAAAVVAAVFGSNRVRATESVEDLPSRLAASLLAR